MSLEWRFPTSEPLTQSGYACTPVHSSSPLYNDNPLLCASVRSLPRLVARRCGAQAKLPKLAKFGHRDIQSKMGQTNQPIRDIPLTLFIRQALAIVYSSVQSGRASHHDHVLDAWLGHLGVQAHVNVATCFCSLAPEALDGMKDADSSKQAKRPSSPFTLACHTFEVICLHSATLCTSVVD
eukprot:349850-Chlamydomonas_euryale.AAC.11